MEDWFRRTSWSEDDQRDFRARLARARPHNRAQYRAIQADALANAELPLHREAIALLREMLADAPGPIAVSDAWRQIGESREALGDIAGALEAYAAGVEAMRAFPQVRTRAPIALALLIARERLADRYDEALALLDEFDKDVTLPVDRFERYAVRAIIHAERGETSDAAWQAGAALEAAARERSGFAKHPAFGLVGPRQSALVERMRAIAEPAGLMGRLRSAFRRGRA